MNGAEVWDLEFTLQDVWPGDCRARGPRELRRKILRVRGNNCIVQDYPWALHNTALEHAHPGRSVRKPWQWLQLKSTCCLVSVERRLAGSVSVGACWCSSEQRWWLKGSGGAGQSRELPQRHVLKFTGINSWTIYRSPSKDLQLRMQNSPYYMQNPPKNIDIFIPNIL